MRYNWKTFKEKWVSEILIAILLLFFIIISQQNFFIFQIGNATVNLVYPFVILAGLLLNFALGLITIVAGDTLGSLLDDGFNRWHYAHFMTLIIIFIVTYALKMLFYINNHHILIAINLAVFAIVTAILIYFSVSEHFFKSTTDKIVFFIIGTLMLSYSVITTFFYGRYQTEDLKDFVIINIIISLVIILRSFYFPVAMILELSDNPQMLGTPKNTHSNLWKSFFRVFLELMILEMPVNLLFYHLLVLSLYKFHQKINPLIFYG